MKSEFYPRSKSNVKVQLLSRVLLSSVKPSDRHSVHWSSQNWQSQTDKRKHWPEGSNKYIATFPVFVVLPRCELSATAWKIKVETWNPRIANVKIWNKLKPFITNKKLLKKQSSSNLWETVQESRKRSGRDETRFIHIRSRWVFFWKINFYNSQCYKIACKILLKS